MKKNQFIFEVAVGGSQLQGGGGVIIPCLNPIFDFLNITFKHKLYFNMVKFLFCFIFKGLF